MSTFCLISTAAYVSQGNVVVSNEFARRYGDQGVVSMSCNPGNLKSELQRHLVGLQKRIIVSLLIPDLQSGV